MEAPIAIAARPTFVDIPAPELAPKVDAAAFSDVQSSRPLSDYLFVPHNDAQFNSPPCSFCLSTGGMPPCPNAESPVPCTSNDLAGYPSILTEVGIGPKSIIKPSKRR